MKVIIKLSPHDSFNFIRFIFFLNSSRATVFLRSRFPSRFDLPSSFASWPRPLPRPRPRPRPRHPRRLRRLRYRCCRRCRRRRRCRRSCRRRRRRQCYLSLIAILPVQERDERRRWYEERREGESLFSFPSDKCATGGASRRQ